MIEVTEEASVRIMKFLGEQERIQSIRILMTEGGWKGPYLVMALDDQKPEDVVLMDRGVTFLIEKELYERVKPIHIGYTHSTLGAGYTISSELFKDLNAMNVGCHDICSSCQDIPL